MMNTSLTYLKGIRKMEKLRKTIDKPKKGVFNGDPPSQKHNVF